MFQHILVFDCLLCSMFGPMLVMWLLPLLLFIPRHGAGPQGSWISAALPLGRAWRVELLAKIFKFLSKFFKYLFDSLLPCRPPAPSGAQFSLCWHNFLYFNLLFDVRYCFYFPKNIFTFIKKPPYQLLQTNSI